MAEENFIAVPFQRRKSQRETNVYFEKKISNFFNRLPDGKIEETENNALLEIHKRGDAMAAAARGQGSVQGKCKSTQRQRQPRWQRQEEVNVESTLWTVAAAAATPTFTALIREFVFKQKFYSYCTFWLKSNKTGG